MTQSMPKPVLSHLSGLALPGERHAAVHALSERFGLLTLVIFISDPELDILLPAPGFIQTLPFGKTWREFLKQTVMAGSFEGKLPWESESVVAHGIGGRDGSVMVLVGNTVPKEVVEEWAMLLPALAAALKGERAAASARAQTLLARQVAEQANELSSRLDAARRAAQHEIAARILAEEKVRRINQTLEKRVEERTQSLTEAVAQLEEFSYTVSHDLRAPLRSIANFTQILIQEHGASLPSEATDFLKRILESSHRMNQLTQDVLSFTRISQSEFPCTRMNLDKMMDEIVRQYHQSAPQAQITLRKPLGSVLASTLLLPQCINNLLDNAIKYCRADTSTEIEIRTERRGAFLRILVKDNGVGIPEQYHERIFKIFERLDSKKPGTGVGLAIVRRAVDRMRGKLGVISEDNVGSTFWIELPAGEPAPPALPIRIRKTELFSPTPFRRNVKSGSRNLLQLRLGPRFFSITRGFTRLFHRGGIHRIRPMLPLATNVGQDRGDLLVVEHPQRGHFQIIRASLHRERPAQSMQNNPRQALRGTQHPFRIRQRRRQTFHAETRQLMARRATRRE